MRRSGPVPQRAIFAEYAPPSLFDVVQRATLAFDPITLGELGTAALMDRIDTKFLLPLTALPEVLGRCRERYRTLEVAGRRLSRYHTVYLDTADFALYHAHHNGRYPRRKLRVRTYVDTGERYLELKVKHNTGRGVKSRVRLDPAAPLSDQIERSPLRGKAGVEPEALRESVTICYSRMTLVARDTPERVTLDLELELTLGDRSCRHPRVVIAEVKQERRASSEFIDAMRFFGFREYGVSKYCLGVASLAPAAKKNLYRQLLSRIEKTGADSSPYAVAS